MGDEDDTIVPLPRRRVRIEELRPRWLVADDSPRRWQMGVAILCPGHLGLTHDLEFWFLNPGDGGPPSPLTQLYFRAGSELHHLTLASGYMLDGGKRAMVERIDIEHHWCGFFFDGWLIDALRIGA